MSTAYLSSKTNLPAPSSLSSSDRPRRWAMPAIRSLTTVFPPFDLMKPLSTAALTHAGDRSLAPVHLLHDRPLRQPASADRSARCALSRRPPYRQMSQRSQRDGR